MAQKLLEKPPFKYLFDIVTETTNQTGNVSKVTFKLGFAKGIYNAEELDSNFYDSKEKKITYLKKIIDLTQMFQKEPIAAKPNKIVAGLEPENTNLMLQAIYKAAISGQFTEAHAKKVLIANGEAPPEKAAPQ